jgi:hypothetical protein
MVANGESVCAACGESTSEIRKCPYCGGEKCDACDMGDDVECMLCDLDERECSEDQSP